MICEEWDYLTVEEKLEYLKREIESLESVRMYTVNFESLDVILKECIGRVNSIIRALAREYRELKMLVNTLNEKLLKLENKLNEINS